MNNLIKEEWKRFVEEDPEYKPIYLIHGTYKSRRSRRKNQRPNMTRHIKQYVQRIANVLRVKIKILASMGRGNHSHMIMLVERDVDNKIYRKWNIQKLFIDFWQGAGRIKVDEYDASLGNAPAYILDNETRRGQSFNADISGIYYPR